MTIQDQVLRLLHNLVLEKHTSVILITHTLGVVRETTDRVYVMYAGNMVESAPTKQLFDRPSHPYTQGLLQSIPKLGDRARQGRLRLQEIEGIVPSLYAQRTGCSFAPRCPQAMEVCRTAMPDLLLLDGSRRVRCHLYGEGS